MELLVYIFYILVLIMLGYQSLARGVVRAFAKSSALYSSSCS